MKHLIVALYVLILSVAYGAFSLASGGVAETWSLAFVLAVLAPVAGVTVWKGGGP